MIKYMSVTNTEKGDGKMADKKSSPRTIAQNKKAWHDYFVDEKYEAGIALFGTEVKSIRQGAVNLKDSYCHFDKGELFAVGLYSIRLLTDSSVKKCLNFLKPISIREKIPFVIP